MTNLNNWVEQAFKDFNPLDSLDNHLGKQGNQNSFHQFIEERVEDLNPEQKQRVFDELFDWGPLVPFKDQDDLFEIMIVGYRHIFIETSKGKQKLADSFLSEQSFKNFYERLCDTANLVINKSQPFGDGQVHSFRLHIVTPPIAQKVTVTLRKQRKQHFSFNDFSQSGFLNEHNRQLIEDILNERQSTLIIGPTGSGKTTFLNSLLAELPKNERLVILEDTDELKIPNQMSTKMLTREDQNGKLNTVTMNDLVKQSLRMRPDRIVVGEVRGAEAKDLLQALATGHSGSFGTLHAHSAKQALLRLEMLIQMGAPQWSLHSIRQLIQFSIQTLIVLKGDKKERGIQEICQITSHEKFGLLLQPMHHGVSPMNTSINF